MDEKQVGLLAQDLHTGYMAYAGITSIMRHPYLLDTVTRLERENTGPAPVPVESIIRKDGSAAFFDVSHAIRQVSRTPSYKETHDRLWLSGALLTLGDELAHVRYFDKGPDLEFIRHLRNGVGHGNRFNLLYNEPRLPAHFTGPERRLMIDGKTSTPPGEATTFEVTASLNGQPILFDFIGPGDVCDLLLFVSWRLIRIGNGDPVSPLWLQRS